MLVIIYFALWFTVFSLSFLDYSFFIFRITSNQHQSVHFFRHLFLYFALFWGEFECFYLLQEGEREFCWKIGKRKLERKRAREGGREREDIKVLFYENFCFSSTHFRLFSSPRDKKFNCLKIILWNQNISILILSIFVKKKVPEIWMIFFNKTSKFQTEFFYIKFKL